MKKSILVLTDLSDNSLHAAETALHFAGPLHNNLILLNCNDVMSVFAYYPVTPVMVESPLLDQDRETKLKLLTKHLKGRFEETNPDAAKLSIITLINQGDLYSNVRDILKQYPVDLIIMGQRSGSSTEHFLFGSDTRTVADHSPVPVIIVSPGAPLRAIRQITFATNFLGQDIAILHYLTTLCKNLEARLQIVHIRQYGKTPTSKNPGVKKTIDDICTANPSVVVYHEVYGKEVTSRLNHFCKENGTDLLALSHEHHSFLFRTFKLSTVERSLAEHQVSLLIIPGLKPHETPVSTRFQDLSNIVF